MMRQVLLLVDNDSRFRSTWGKVVSKAGYEVKLAANPKEARDILRETKIDLAIIDVRLEDEDRPEDISGFNLAREEEFRNVPKIILTHHKPTAENMAEAFHITADKLPSAIDYMNKDDGPNALLEKIRQALEIWPQLRISTIKVSQQIKADYETARKQANSYYNVSRAVSIVGFVVIFAGIGLAWLDKLSIAIVGTANGIALQVISYLFFRRLDVSNNRMDAYHRELLETYWLELLMAACEQLPSDKQVQGLERSITAAANRWLAPPPARETSKAEKKEKSQD